MFTTNNNGEFIDAKLTSSRYNVQCIGMDGMGGPSTSKEFLVQEAKQNLIIYEEEETGYDIIEFKVKDYTPDKKLVYSAYLGSAEACHGSVRDDGSFYCMIDEINREDLRVKLHSPYGLGDDVWYDGPDGSGSVNDFKYNEVN